MQRCDTHLGGWIDGLSRPVGLSSYQLPSAAENRARRTAALTAIALALLCLALGKYRQVFYAGYIFMILAGLLFTPSLSLGLSKLLRHPLGAIRPVEGLVAADSLIQAPRRTSATVAVGVLRAVGGLRAQIRRTIWMEAAAIGVIGLLLGNAIGAINLYYEVRITGHEMAGFALRHMFPLEVAAMLLPIILGAAIGAAIMPAESAVRSSLIEALEYE